jgi:hypothetical protein
MARLLRSGKNVITPWPSMLMWSSYGRSVMPEAIAEIEAAAHEGGASLFATGTDPGIATDALPALLSGASGSVERVTVQELGDYSPLAPTGLLTDPGFLSFGQPLDYAGRSWVEEPAMQKLGGAMPSIIAAALGHEPTRIEFFEHGVCLNTAKNSQGAMLVTATRCANAVGAVCAASPGIRTIFDFRLGELTLGRPPERG